MVAYDVKTLDDFAHRDAIRRSLRSGQKDLEATLVKEVERRLELLDDAGFEPAFKRFDGEIPQEILAKIRYEREERAERQVREAVAGMEAERKRIEQNQFSESLRRRMLLGVG